MLFPSTDDGTRIEAYAEVVGSNPTRSIFINLVEYGIRIVTFFDFCPTKTRVAAFGSVLGGARTEILLY
jgi:hypothetical protein